MFVVPHAADQHARALFNRKGDPKRAGRNDGGQSARPSLREDDRVRAVQYDSIVQVIAHGARQHPRSEEHTSELQSLMRISYAVCRLKKKTIVSEYSNPTTTAHTHTEA